MRTFVFLLITVCIVAPRSANSSASEVARGAMMSAFNEELAVLDGQLAKEPEKVQLYSRRGDLHLFLGRFNEAVADFEKMISLDPAQDAPHWRLGIAYYLSGDFAKSAKQFEKYHAYDNRDRENGIWKFLAQARVEGIEKARKEMLEYMRFDREPFPMLYEMFAARKSGEEVFAHIAEKQLQDDPKVMFFARYYVGLNEDLLVHSGMASDDRRKAARMHLEKAVALFTPETAQADGPGYMWQVARLHLSLLKP